MATEDSVPALDSVPGPQVSVRNVSRRQGIYWMLTIPQPDFTPYPVRGSTWFRGQLETAASGYVHWQACIAFSKKKSLRQVKEIFGQSCHAELTRSEAAFDYVFKEDTRVDGTQFEFGGRPFDRTSRECWERIWESAVSGSIIDVEASIRVCHYRTLRLIASDYGKPVGMERVVRVFWGPTGTGKSRRAWEEATMDAYAKDPLTKFWCGYAGEKNVVIDEFRGVLSISHLLRWFDRYPVRVETKGGSAVLRASSIWITSNLHPRSWYPDLDEETYLALERRLEIINIV